MLAVFGKDMLGVFEVEERPALFVAAQDDMSATAAVAAVGAGFGVVFDAK